MQGKKFFLVHHIITETTKTAVQKVKITKFYLKVIIEALKNTKIKVVT